MSFGNNDEQKHNHSHSPISQLWTHTSSYSPHQCVLGGNLPEGKSTVGAAQFQGPIHQEGICDFGVWGRKGTKIVSVCVMETALGETATDRPESAAGGQTFKTS